MATDSPTNQDALEARLWEMMTAFFRSRGLHAFALLRIADLLGDDSCTAAELAPRAGCNAAALHRLMRALATEDILVQQGDRFSLTPLGKLLRSDVPRSQRALTAVLGRDWEDWSELPDIIRTGKKMPRAAANESPYGAFKGTEADATVFDEAMDTMYYAAPAPMLGCYDFSGIKTVCDIGGGSGVQMAAILSAIPQLMGMIFDLPETISGRTQPTIDSAGLKRRCECIGGDFFQSVPRGADLYVLRHIIHNWDDEKAVAILKNVAAVLPANGKLLLVDWAIMPDRSRPFNKWRDLSMLVFSAGAERTPEEHEGLFQKAGLKLIACKPGKLDTVLIEAARR